MASSVEEPTPAQIAEIREYVHDEPSDDDLAILWKDKAGSLLDVAIAVLSHRRAGFLRTAADISIPQQVRINTRTNIEALDDDIARLRTWKAADDAGVDRDSYIPGIGTLTTFDIVRDDKERLFIDNA